MPVPIYYINLAKRSDRRQFMEEQFKRLGIEAERIEAVTPAEITPEDLALYCDTTRPMHLRPGQLACSMSHERAWRTMLALGHEGAVILEDDATLSTFLPSFLSAVDDIKFDILRFERPSRKVRVLPSIAKVGPDIAIRPFRSTLAGRSGYIISSRAARVFLAHRAMRRMGGDRVVNGALAAPGPKLTRVLTDPALCVQLGNSREHKIRDGVDRSDIDRKISGNAFAARHPLRYFSRRAAQELSSALLSTVDHIVHLPKGISKESIRFGSADIIKEP